MILIGREASQLCSTKFIYIQGATFNIQLWENVNRDQSKLSFHSTLLSTELCDSMLRYSFANKKYGTTSLIFYLRENRSNRVSMR